MHSAVGVGSVGVADGEGAIGVILRDWRVSWWSVGVGVVGVGAGRGLRLGGRQVRACHSWLVVGRFVVLVGWCRLFPVLERLVLWVDGGGAVLLLSAVLVTVWQGRRSRRCR